MFKSIKFWIYASGIVGILTAGWFVKSLFDKAKERDAYALQNQAMKAEKSVLADSLQLYKEQLTKAFVDAKNKSELYAINSSLLPSTQLVVKVMRDSVIKINKDRAKLEGQVLELQKDLERAKKKRKFL